MTKRILFALVLLGAAVRPASAEFLYKAGAVGFVQSAVDGQVYFDVNTTSTGSAVSASLTQDNIVERASANFQTGELKVFSSGSLANDYGQVNASSAAFLVDTITASGSLGGLNLGATLSISGTTNTSDIAANNNFLLVGFYNRGHLDAAERGVIDFYDPQYRLWGAAYTLGSRSNLSPDLGGYNYGSIAGHFGDGAHQVPLTIPFAVLGRDFEIHLILISYQSANSVTLQTWTNDFGSTVGVRLSADPGITLSSASGVLPGTIAAVSEVPEPGTLVLVSAGLGLLFLRRRRA